MIEGKIISFYREKRQMTQRDLGIGICSSTHVSKIERGLTEYSIEVLNLLANRLQVDLKKEIETYYSIKSMLHDWMNAIIMRQKKKAERIKLQLEEIELLELSDFQQSFKLIHIRYSMLIGHFSDVPLMLREMEKEMNLSSLDANLLLHSKAIYLMQFKRDYQLAMVLLRQIDESSYPYHEYYYHLALNHHFLRQHIYAYKYASRSLEYFMKTNNFVRIIDAKMLILVLLEYDHLNEDKGEVYRSMLEMTETLGLHDQHSFILHNYAYHQLAHHRYGEAMELYKRSMRLKDPQSSVYLESLEGYVHAASKSGKKSVRILLEQVEAGLGLAEELQDERHVHLFKLHRFRILDQPDDYYGYLENYAYPYFSTNGMHRLKEYYHIQLYHHFMKTGQIEKANSFSRSYIEPVKQYDVFA
ncbi:helix-turn-helix domain-containing protein [Rossellomorea sp. y25]|uniref:helix-turn-helix domain-containing protein n=1 Tax=Rossellomorea sp. y25 TaxID=3118174 RepID=UPI0026183B06|nr:helix-turn-helix transcriptional regulator [uncultured Rossellomorea sp.]